MSDAVAAIWGFVGAILGALIGGGLTIWASHQAVWVTEKKRQTALAATILGELLAADSPDEGPDDGLGGLLREWANNGDDPNLKYWASVYDIEPMIQFPAYYASVPSLGILGKDLARRIVLYHSEAIALSLIGSRAFRSEPSQELKRTLAEYIITRTDALSVERKYLIDQLNKRLH